MTRKQFGYGLAVIALAVVANYVAMGLTGLPVTKQPVDVPLAMVCYLFIGLMNFIIGFNFRLVTRR